ncbi:MAG: hypothetical protein IKS51_05760 [Erysipelotrichaceae bacterium]|nr:hypothetical protein [Erysipelotrichaceae bacterium]
MIIEGAIAVKSAINNHKRTVSKVFIDRNKKTKDFNYIRKLCRISGIDVQEMEMDELRELLKGKTHGGIGAEVSERKEDDFSQGDIFYLEGIEDPFNLGYAMRTLYALGINNVLLGSRDYTGMQDQLLKSSAGAYDFLNVRIIKDEISELKQFKETGYHLYSLYRGEDSKDIFEVAFKDKALYMLGGEKRGLKTEVLELADESLYISYGNEFRNALNACAAVDVVATLRYSQKRK